MVAKFVRLPPQYERWSRSSLDCRRSMRDGREVVRLPPQHERWSRSQALSSPRQARPSPESGETERVSQESSREKLQANGVSSKPVSRWEPGTPPRNTK